MDLGSWEMDTQVHRKVSNGSGSLLRGPELRLGLLHSSQWFGGTCGSLDHREHRKCSPGVKRHGWPGEIQGVALLTPQHLGLAIPRTVLSPRRQSP